MSPSEKNAHVMKLWKKALKSSLVTRRRIDMYEIVKRHPDVFKTKDIVYTKQTMWKLWQSLSPQEQLNPQSDLHKGMTQGQVKIMQQIKQPKRGETDPFLNYFNAKNKIIEKMGELDPNTWNHPSNPLQRNSRQPIEVQIEPTVSTKLKS